LRAKVRSLEDDVQMMKMMKMLLHQSDADKLAKPREELRDVD